MFASSRSCVCIYKPRSTTSVLLWRVQKSLLWDRPARTIRPRVQRPPHHRCWNGRVRSISIDEFGKGVCGVCVSRPRFVSSYSCPRAAADFDFNYSNFFDLHSVFSHGKFFFGRVFQTRYYYTVSGCFSLSLSCLATFHRATWKNKKKKVIRYI